MGADENRPNVQLSLQERQQWVLQSTCDAVQDHLDQHPAAARRSQAVGIDRESMSVIVFWVGDRFDPHTDAAFRRISRRTGVPIVAVPVLLTRDEVLAVHARIFAEQDGVRTAGADLLSDPDTIEVGVVGSLDGRPDHIEINGTSVPLRYHLSDLQALPAAGPED